MSEEKDCSSVAESAAREAARPDGPHSAGWRDGPALGAPRPSLNADAVVEVLYNDERSPRPRRAQFVDWDSALSWRLYQSSEEQSVSPSEASAGTQATDDHKYSISPSSLPEGQDLAELKLGEPDGPLTPRTTYWRDRARTAEATITRLQAQLARAVEIIEPMAAVGRELLRAETGEEWKVEIPDDKAIFGFCGETITAGALRRASEVFTSLSEKGESQ